VNLVQPQPWLPFEVASVTFAVRLPPSVGVRLRCHDGIVMAAALRPVWRQAFDFDADAGLSVKLDLDAPDVLATVSKMIKAPLL
jgi:hypothetical protein